MEEKNKTTTAVNKVESRLGRYRYLLMIISVNVFFAITLTVFMTTYNQLVKKSMLEAKVSATTDTIEAVAKQFGDFLVSQSMIATGYSSYITSEGMDLEHAKKYLKNWAHFYDSIIIVDVDDKQALRLIDEQEKQVDIAVIPDIPPLCHKYNKIDTSVGNVLITDIYSNSDGTNMVAFYHPLIIDGKQMLIFFEISVEKILVAGMSSESVDFKSSLLLDTDYRIMYGRMKWMGNSVDNNFLNLMSDIYGSDFMFARKQELVRYGKSIYSSTYDDGKRYTAICERLPNTNNWVFVYSIDHTDIAMDGATVNLAILMMVFWAIWLAVDITFYIAYYHRLRNSMELVKKQNDDLQRANAAKTAFVSNMSHEIRTPINAVLGMDEMIIKESSDRTIKAYASDIQKAGRTLLGIINDVLDFTKIESGKLEIIPAEYSISELIKETYMMIKYRTDAKFLNFDVRIDANMPKTLYGDDIRVRQVIVNLLTNAVKYTNEGAITLTIESHPIDEKHINLYVAVKDTGIGMKPEEMSKLFVDFGRLDEKRNRSIEGTGLGLPIVSRLLNMMGSKLEVDSAYGVGSNFYFTLEQQIVDSTPTGFVDLEARDEIIDVKDSDFIAPDAKILVVDDTIVNLKVVRGLLKDTKIQIETATSGQECLQKATSTKYDLIFLDHRMPKMDGIETLHNLKSTGGPNLGTPIIALTANVVSGAKEMYLSEGFTDFLSKPVDSAHLADMLIKHLPKTLIKKNITPDTVAPVKAEKTRIASEIINVSVGLDSCGGSMDVYREVLEQFVGEATVNCGRLLQFMVDKDLENYCILVHGMKSAARLIGSADVADKAYELEKKSGAGDIIYIGDHTNDFLKEYMELSDAAAEIAKK